jgi:hypothetical protein
VALRDIEELFRTAEKQMVVEIQSKQKALAGNVNSAVLR